jgi:succinate dehydrogenase / fumarate reductase flavoprotein subunit
LSETLIAGRRSGEAAAAYSLEAETFTRSRRAIGEALDELDATIRPGSELARPLQRRLRDLMWERCGVVRTEAALREALDELAELTVAAAQVDVRPGEEGWADLAQALDLRSGLVVAEATLRCAIERRETRGAQIRSDVPELDPALQLNFYVDARLKPWAEPVQEVPVELRDRTDVTVPITSERLLE